MRIRGFHTHTFQAPPDGGSGGGAAAVATPPAAASAPAPAGPASTPTPPPAPAAPPAGPPAAAAPPAAPTQYTYPDDRSNWVPPDQLTQAQQARLAAEHRARTLQAMAEAAGGIALRGPEAPPDPRITAAREALEQVFPGISDFHARMKPLSELAAVLEQHGIGPDQFARLPELLTATDMRYRGTARQVSGRVLSGLTEGITGREMTPDQRADVLHSFERWLRSDQARADRYVEGDLSVADEFIAAYRQHIQFFGPTGAAPAAAAAAAAAALPPAPAGGAPPAPGGAPSAPLTLEQRLDSAWTGFTAGRRA
jgi:hypothetical protein